MRLYSPHPQLKSHQWLPIYNKSQSLYIYLQSSIRSELCLLCGSNFLPLSSLPSNFRHSGLFFFLNLTNLILVYSVLTGSTTRNADSGCRRLSSSSQCKSLTFFTSSHYTHRITPCLFSSHHSLNCLVSCLSL